MKVIDYIKRHKLDIPEKMCPKLLYAYYDTLLYKMAVECCESSRKGDCIPHFLDAEVNVLK